MRYANFPGCSAKTTGRAYTESFGYVAERVGIQLDDIPDWICCGASAGAGASDLLADALPARSLAHAEAAYGDEPVLALCAGCYRNLRHAQLRVRDDAAAHAQIEEAIGMPYAARADVVNGIEPFLDDDVQKAVSAQVTEPLNGLKVACYYGCALVRPRALKPFDDDENPQSMERIVALTGAEPVAWERKTECCGASHHTSVPGAMAPLIERLFEDAKAHGAEAIATACPLCQLNLDMRQKDMDRRRAAAGKEPLGMPVYYFTELIAASFGGPVDQIGLTRHFLPAEALIAEAKKREVKHEPTPEELRAQRIAEAKRRKQERAAAQAAGNADGQAAQAQPTAAAAQTKGTEASDHE